MKSFYMLQENPLLQRDSRRTLTCLMVDVICKFKFLKVEFTLEEINESKRTETHYFCLFSLRAFCLPWLLDLAVNTLPFLRSKASGYSGTISLRARWRKTALISPPQCP